MRPIRIIDSEEGEIQLTDELVLQALRLFERFPASSYVTVPKQEKVAPFVPKEGPTVPVPLRTRLYVRSQVGRFLPPIS